MSHPELLILGVLRALVEVAMWFLAGQGLLYILAGRGRVNNPMYKLFLLVTSPVIKLMRLISPPQILDKHLHMVEVLLAGDFELAQQLMIQDVHDGRKIYMEYWFS